MHRKAPSGGPPSPYCNTAKHRVKCHTRVTNYRKCINFFFECHSKQHRVFCNFFNPWIAASCGCLGKTWMPLRWIRHGLLAENVACLGCGVGTAWWVQRQCDAETMLLSRLQLGVVSVAFGALAVACAREVSQGLQ